MLGSIIGGVASLIGALGSRDSGDSWTDPYEGGMSPKAFAQQRQLAREQYQYQQALMREQFFNTNQLRSTAHQVEVNDLRKAGLNPILSATGGNGASSALGSVGYSMPSLSNVSSAATTASQADKALKVNTALGVVDRFLSGMKLGIDRINAEANQNSSLANLQNASTNSVNSASTVGLQAIQGKNFDAQTKRLLTLMLLDNAQANKANADAYATRALLPSQIDLNESTANSTLPRIVSNVGRAMGNEIKESYAEKQKQSVNSAKDVSMSPIDIFMVNKVLPLLNKYLK